MDCGNKKRGDKNLKMKKFIVIVFLIIGVPSIIFIADDNRRNKYENPFEIGKAFSYYYMTKSSEDMKLCADKNIYEKIDGLQYPVPYIYEHNYWDDVELICSRKIWNTIVCTYAYYEYGKNLSFLYSVVLKPTGLPSLWDRTKDFIYIKVPFGDKFISSTIHKQRWLVVDFFTTDDFENYYITSQEESFDLINQDKIDEFLSIIEKELEQSLLIAQKMWNWNNSNEWGKREMVRQNREIKKLYADIFKETNNNNE